MELTAYIREFAESAAFRELLVERVEQVLLVVISLDSCSPELISVEIAFDAAGAAGAAYYLSLRGSKEEFSFFQAAVHHVCSVLADGFSVALVCCEQGSVHESVSHEFISNNGNVIGYLYPQLVELVYKAVGHIVVGADYCLRQIQLAAVIALCQLLAGVCPVISVVDSSLVILYTVLLK